MQSETDDKMLIDNKSWRGILREVLLLLYRHFPDKENGGKSLNFRLYISP